MVCFADQNGDGQLGIDEFRVVYDIIRSRGMENFLREAVTSCPDLLDEGEWINLLADSNGDGILEKSEYPGDVPTAQWNAIVCAADLNGD